MRKCLTSKELKLKKKEHNIAGLQIADLLAYPSYRATLVAHGEGEIAGTFNEKIAEILEASKYDRSPQGKITGWGRKLLP